MRNIFEVNERQKEDKENQSLQNKKRDKELIDRAVEKEKQILQLERQMKEKERAEAKLVLKSIKNRSEERAAFEKGLEEIVDRQRQRQQREQDEAWERKEREKFQFMHDVFKSREEIMKQHMAEKEKARKVKKQERVDVDRMMSEHLDAEVKVAEEEWKKEKKSKKELLMQISE